MANNRIYILCTECGSDDPLYLGKRYKNGYYLNDASTLVAAHGEWFDKHKHCGGTHDHFSIGYEHPQNYDMHGMIATLEEKLE